MKSAVIVFPASNCDRDAQTALTELTGTAPHMVWHGETEVPDVDLIVLPGGFSYGDYLRCGAMAAQSRIMRDVVKKADEGVAVIGICNGFQILTEAHLLPGALLRNADLKFVSRPVELVVEESQSSRSRMDELRRFCGAGAVPKHGERSRSDGRRWATAVPPGRQLSMSGGNPTNRWDGFFRRIDALWLSQLV